MCPQMPPFAVHRHHVGRPGRVEDVEQLTGGSVAGGVHLRHPLVDDLGTPAGQTIDHAVDRVLVAGDQAGREHHCVASLDLDGVVAVGHPGQSRQRLALRPGRDQTDVAVRQRTDVPQIDHKTGRHPQQPEITSYPHVTNHRPPDKAHRAAMGLRRVENLLDPVHVAGKAGDDDPLLGIPEHAVEHRRNLPLGGHEAWHLGVGGVGQEQVNAFPAKPRETTEIGQPAVKGQLVHLEVAGVQHQAGRRADGDRQRVRDGVVDREELTGKRTEAADLLLPDLDHGRADAVLGELGRGQRKGEPGTHQRNVAAFAQQVGYGTDVILMGVGEDNRVNRVEPVPDGGEVRQDQIHTRLVRLGEQDPTVDDEQPAIELEHGHIAADFAQPPQRDDAQTVSGQRRRCSQPGMGMAHADPTVAFTSTQRSTPAAARSTRNRSRSSSVASTRGRRTPPAGSPAMLRAAFVMITPWFLNRPSYAGSRPMCKERARTASPASKALIIAWIRLAATCPTTLTTPTAPTDNNGRVSISVPE